MSTVKLGKPKTDTTVTFRIKVPDKARKCDECFKKWLAKVKKDGNPIHSVDYDKKEVIAGVWK